MNDLPPRAPNVIRKASYGRTELFLPSESEILREVKCMGGITRHDTATVYHLIPEAYKMASPETPVCCWHCCEEMVNPKEVIPLPRLFDPSERLFHVYGATCSPGCAKAYILEHTTFDKGQHLNVLSKMLREVYNVTEPVSETPPRPALKRFGGVFDPHKKRRPAECRIVQPPFVSYCMLVEEKNQSSKTLSDIPRPPLEGSAMDLEEADTFDEPQPPGLFEKYVSERTKPSQSTRSEPKTMSRKRPAPAVGPMSKFVRK